jgi:hypothetical protein
MSFGWVDLEDVLNLAIQNRVPEWLTLRDLNTLLHHKENHATIWKRTKECQDVVRTLQDREYDKKAAKKLNLVYTDSGR